jgi:lysozyme
MRTNAEGLKIIERFEDAAPIDIARAEAAVLSLVYVELTTNQFSALVSFVLSIGIRQFRVSSAREFINTRQMLKAAAEIMIWTPKGKEDRKLIRRRKAEKALFLKPELVRKE